MSAVNTRLGDAVKRVLEEHGLTRRGQRARTGLSHVTVGQMIEGFPVQMDSVVAFARGFGLDVNEWLKLAGYEPIELTASGSETLIAGISALQQELGRPILISFDHSIRANLTVEEAEKLLAHIREQAEAGVF